MHALHSLETEFNFFHLNCFFARSNYSFKLHILYVLLVDVIGSFIYFSRDFGNGAGGGVERKYDWLWGSHFIIFGCIMGLYTFGYVCTVSECIWMLL